MSRIRAVRRDSLWASVVFWKRGGPVAPPRYRYPLLPLLSFGRDLALGRRRSIVRDSLRVMAFNSYPRRYEGTSNIPQDGPFLLVCNHYARHGLQPYHWGMAVTAALSKRRPKEPNVRWVIIAEWHGRRIGPLPIPPSIFRWVFGRVARIYDLVAVPSAATATVKRAATLRRLLELARQGPIGLAPEGRGSGVLRPPPQGSGLLLYALNRSGPPILPTGIWEEGDELVIHFGAPFDLAINEKASRRERDRMAQEAVMVAIGRLLPPKYWGDYTAAIASAKDAQG